ncbi:MAG: ribosome small subunit-dependent GTPase A [Rhabdochlamydiaceae bacterium]|nr:ribosome small subunit-dependent GTPase A [Rhabdochlamydiaceae bacterium]
MSKKDDIYHYEEDFHARDRKQHRKERKIAVQKDRSKYKKSDQDQLKKNTPRTAIDASLPKGRVIAILPEGIIVKTEEKEILCSLKGALKQDKSRTKNLIAVGDFVRFEDKGQEQGIISSIEERTSILSRADNLSRNKEQLIAVNIDQVIITSSVLIPNLKPPLVDRYIIATDKGNMQPLLVVNKIDLLTHPPEHTTKEELAQEKEIYDAFVQAYRALGIQVIPVSAATQEGIEELKAAMRNKTSVFSGQSGVGKSSLINLVAGTSLATGSIVQSTRKGSHTTTTTHLVPLEGGGFCIDTPGIKSFGLWDLEAQDLAAYYPEITELSSECRFPDCSHQTEPGCRVRQAAEEKEISPLRFASYCALMTSLSEEHRHR